MLKQRPPQEREPRLHQKPPLTQQLRAGETAGIAARHPRTAPAHRFGRKARTQQSQPESDGAPKPDKQETKADLLMELLKREQGASIDELTAASGWQAHSVRGFISGTLKKRLGLSVISDKDATGTRHYRIAG